MYLIKLECWPSCVLVLWNGLCPNLPRVPENDGGGALDCNGRAYPGLDCPGSGMYSVFPNGSKGGYRGGGRFCRFEGFLPLLLRKMSCNEIVIYLRKTVNNKFFIVFVSWLTMSYHYLREWFCRTFLLGTNCLLGTNWGARTNLLDEGEKTLSEKRLAIFATFEL